MADISDAYSKAVASGEKKIKQLNQSPERYVMSAVLAGAYLTIVGFVFWSIRQYFGADPSGRLISSLFFGVGLSVIIFTGTELFTSNNMYMTISTMERKTSWADTVRLWVVCWLGNFAGAALVALLLWAAHVTAGIGHDHALMDGARHKMEGTAGDIFFKGILANWIVCLAAWVNLNLKEEIARFMAIILVVFIFLYLAFEHSIANMGTFSIALFADPSLPLADIGHNLLWATLGNIVGGAVGLGLTSWVMNRGK